MAEEQNFCLVVSTVEVVDIKIRAFSASGERGAEETLAYEDKKKLALSSGNGDILKYEVWDLDWTPKGCYGPVSNGDTIVFKGAANGFSVEINGEKAEPVDCPD